MSCSKQSVRTEGLRYSERREFIIHRVTVIENDKYFSTKVTASIEPSSPDIPKIPSSTTLALTELGTLLTLPPSGLPLNATRACRLDFRLPLSLNGYSHRCAKTLCLILPPEDRDPPCSFFTKVGGWIEKNWLGGSCYSIERGKSELVNSFRSKGVDDCHTMSSILLDALLIKTSGRKVSMDDLISMHLKRNSML